VNLRIQESNDGVLAVDYILESVPHSLCTPKTIPWNSAEMQGNAGGSFHSARLPAINLVSGENLAGR
jgi:hypothetical protein